MGAPTSWRPVHLSLNSPSRPSLLSYGVGWSFLALAATEWLGRATDNGDAGHPLLRRQQAVVAYGALMVDIADQRPAKAQSALKRKAHFNGKFS